MRAILKVNVFRNELSQPEPTLMLADGRFGDVSLGKIPPFELDYAFLTLLNKVGGKHYSTAVQDGGNGEATYRFFLEDVDPEATGVTYE